MKRLVVLIGLATVLFGVAACYSQTTGEPTAGPTTGGPTSTGPTSGGAPTSSTNGGSLPVDQPCSLLSSSDLTQLGVSGSTTTDMIGTAHACEMDTSADHVIVAIRTDTGLSGFQASGGQIKDTQIGSHPAKQVVDNTGSCVIGIGVSDSSRVDVTATGNGTTDPCPTATNVANLVVQRLP